MVLSSFNKLIVNYESIILVRCTLFLSMCKKQKPKAPYHTEGQQAVERKTTRMFHLTHIVDVFMGLEVWCELDGILDGKVSIEFEDKVWCVAPINIMDNMKASCSCLTLFASASVVCLVYH